MDITLEQSLASVIRYIQMHSGITENILFDEIPEEFAYPTIYFQAPRTKIKKVTLAAFETTFTLKCWFMCQSTYQAYSYAAGVRDHILLDNCIIPIAEKDGTFAGRGIRVYGLETTDIDTGVEQLSITFRDIFSPYTDCTKIQNVIYNGIAPQKMVQEAWNNAKIEIEKEKEA